MTDRDERVLGNVGMQRRQLLYAALLSPLASARVGAAATLVPMRARGAAQLDVRDFGVRGDGVHDDTLALQRAVDALPSDGGTVRVGPGNYLVDPARSLRLRSRMHLQLAPGATLVAKSNALERAYVVLIQDAHDVEVSGGAIVGDRDRHLGLGGEWGHGLTSRGSSAVTIRDIRISRCWGDGISIGADASRPGRPVPTSRDVVVARVVCVGNRRQGLTIGRSQNVRVYDSEFSDTGGTAPQAGIDIEPDSPSDAGDIRIERCLVRNNRGPGIQVYRRVWGVTIADCTIAGNQAPGIVVVGARDSVIAGNRIHDNRQPGISLRGNAVGVEIRGNQFDANGMETLNAGAARDTATPAWRRQVHVADDAHGVTFSDNVGGG
ncbi:right-handed parallel beta-helix repeat-containing protein [Cognatiluteimonas profundi]|uniref:right-handed parallel beta-helix repeat-containing protein n=1 Tax=Cognatiluteimonas profundi TaxID=2594501 RepID=UPI00131AD123|nr:right-handed parallel beta-helix repeat-containing protein [Lysobacter profundi]